MKILRHQPLLIWTLSLVLMLAVLAVGLGGGKPVSTTPAEPTAASGFRQAQEILQALPSVHAAIAAGDLEDWSLDMSRIAAAGRELDAGSGQEAHWDEVIGAIENVSGAAAGEEPVLVLAELEDLGTSVMALARSYQNP